MTEQKTKRTRRTKEQIAKDNAKKAKPIAPEAPVITQEQRKEEVSTNVAPVVESGSEVNTESLMDIIKSDAENIIATDKTNPVPEDWVVTDNILITFTEEELEKLADIEIKFTNGKTRKAKSIVVGKNKDNHTIDIREALNEVLYLISLGAKFDSSVLPRVKTVPFLIKMQLPIEKYQDYVNRVGEFKYDPNTEYYSTNLSTRDYKTFMSMLERYGKAPVYIPPTQRVVHKDSFIIPIISRHPIENTAGVLCKLRDPIKYSKEELEAMDWEHIVLLKKLHNIEVGQRLGIIKVLNELFGND